MDYTAQGLTTNLAARMQQAADPGSILLAPPTQRLVDGYFRVRPLGALSLRGMAGPVEAVALEGEGTVVSRLQASLRRGVSPFRGREAELVRLGEAWERASGGRGEAVCLVGEPGIGKSRLAYEFRRNVGLPAFSEGAAQAYAGGLPTSRSARCCASWPHSRLTTTSRAHARRCTVACGTSRPSSPRSCRTSCRSSARPARPSPCLGTRRPTGAAIARRTPWWRG